MYKALSAFATSVVALSSAANAEQLTYGTYFKNSHNILTDAVQPYFDRISEMTDNELTFRLLTDATVVGASTTAKGIQQGLVSMGTIIPVYTSSTFPMTSLFSNLPTLETDSLIESGTINELFFLNCEECQPEWGAANIKPLAMYGSSPYYLQCVEDVTSLDDLKGKRIQGTGEFGALAAKLGGLPMGLTATELYTGMSQGTLDCVLGSAAWLDTYGLKDVVNYVVELPVGVFRPVNHMNMNAKKWNGLSDEEKNAFTSGVEKLITDAAFGYAAEDQSARDNGAAAGIKFIKPFDDFIAAFDQVGKEGGERFVELAKGKGMKDPEQLLARYLELGQEWREIVANISSPEEYEQALHDRIFSKVDWSAQ